MVRPKMVLACSCLHMILSAGVSLSVGRFDFVVRMAFGSRRFSNKLGCSCLWVSCAISCAGLMNEAIFCHAFQVPANLVQLKDFINQRSGSSASLGSMLK